MSSSTFPVFPSPPSSTVDSTASASSTDSSGDDGSGSTGGAANSSLYLFTFLATLFLLLFVSCAIILRSFILRRRFRQRVEAAILAGVLHPSHGIYLGSLHNFGEKPKMWDTWVAGTGGKEKNGWRDIMPVSVQPLFSSSSDPQSHSHSHTHRHAQDPSSQTFDSAYSSFSTRPLISRLNPFSRRSPSSASTETASSEDAPPPPTSPSDKNQQPDPQPEAMQVSVLIAMPSPHRPSVQGIGNGADMSLKGKARKPSTASWEYEEELPEMVFGVARQALRR